MFYKEIAVMRTSIFVFATGWKNKLSWHSRITFLKLRAKTSCCWHNMFLDKLWRIAANIYSFLFPLFRKLSSPYLIVEWINWRLLFELINCLKVVIKLFKSRQVYLMTFPQKFAMYYRERNGRFQAITRIKKNYFVKMVDWKIINTTNTRHLV